MNESYFTLVAVVSRYLHIVCATLLVGGTLFYEMVVPIAIDDLKPEQQLLVFARARWVFKGIVWFSVVALLVSGILGAYSQREEYMTDSIWVPVAHRPESGPQQAQSMPLPPQSRPGNWFIAHSTAAIIAMIIAVGLTIGKTPPPQPIRWMRIHLVILLLVIFLATATRQSRMQLEATQLQGTAAAAPGP